MKTAAVQPLLKSRKNAYRDAAHLAAFLFWSITYRPRCGYNLYLRYDNSMRLVDRVPSECPNCGLDLERPYVSGSSKTAHCS